ncbi:hypothetical protein Trydic_g21725 [Trypoxylus dichotomus]
MAKFTRVYLLPIINFVWFATGFFVTYILAAHLEHVQPLFSAIRNNGMLSSSSCFLSQFTNLGCVLKLYLAGSIMLVAFNIYIRYRNVEELLKIHHFDLYVKNMNSSCLWFGLIGSLGLSTLANFQQSTVRYIHVVGILLGFVLNTVYQIVHTSLCLVMRRETAPLFINVLRVFIAAASCISLVLFIISYTARSLEVDCENVVPGNTSCLLQSLRSTSGNATKFMTDDAAFVTSAISALAEWKLAFCIISYPLTYAYSIAVCKSHVIPVIPFISDTATFLPESAIFGQLLNMGSILMMVSNYVRYLHVEYVLRTSHLNRYIGILNKTCLWLGFLVTLGVSIVANFQEYIAFTTHLIGSGLAVGFGVFFQISQTVLCILLYPEVGLKCINRIRILLVALSCICLGRCIPPYFVGLSGKEVRSEDLNYNDILLNALAEWMIILLTMVFILTFVCEFKKICLHEPRIDISK